MQKKKPEGYSADNWAGFEHEYQMQLSMILNMDRDHYDDYLFRRACSDFEFISGCLRNISRSYLAQWGHELVDDFMKHSIDPAKRQIISKWCDIWEDLNHEYDISCGDSLHFKKIGWKLFSRLRMTDFRFTDMPKMTSDMYRLASGLIHILADEEKIAWYPTEASRIYLSMEF